MNETGNGMRYGNAGVPRAPQRLILSNLALSNVGCEIIIRGTTSYLSRGLGEGKFRISFPSYHPMRDARLLNNLPSVDVIPMKVHKRLVRGALLKSGRFLRHWTPRFSSRDFRQADVFVSVGGDIYTIFDGNLPLDWIGHETYASKHGIPSVMVGANMENFEVLSDRDRDVLLSHLSRFRLVAVRDQVTADYLESFGVSANTVVLPDPVFALRPKATFEAGRLQRIGVNLSGLAAESDANVMDAYVALVEELLAAGKEVLLIPHVYSPDGMGTMDDRAMLRRVESAVASELREGLTVYEGPIDLESLSRTVACVDAMVGARMHACLNALTLGKPTFFLAYSGKAASMVDWLRTMSPYAKVATCIDSQPLSQLAPSAVTSFLGAAEAFLDGHSDIEIDMTEIVESAAAKIADSIT